MLGFNNYETKEELAVEATTTDVPDIAEEEEDHGTNFLGNLVYKNGHVEIYIAKAREFVKNINIWCGQRCSNEEHINSLARQFTREGYIIGTFKVIRSQEGKIRLIDGAHRKSAIEKILKMQPEFNCEILVELYDTDSLESKHSLRLFQYSNNVLNIKCEDLFIKNALSIVDRLSSRFNGKIFRDTDVNTTCPRPYIHKRKLFEKLKRAFQEHDIDENCLFDQIIDYNETNKKFRLETTDLSVASIKKCKESGCYLGLDRDLSWLDEILSIY